MIDVPTKKTKEYRAAFEMSMAVRTFTGPVIVKTSRTFHERKGRARAPAKGQPIIVPIANQTILLTV